MNNLSLLTLLFSSFLLASLSHPGLLQANPPTNKAAPASKPSTSKTTLRAFRTLQANFIQKQFYAFMKKPIISSGRVYLGKQRMSWATKKPTPSRILLLKQQAYLLYPKLGYKKKMDGRRSVMAAVAQNLSLLCRADQKGLARYYTIKQMGSVWQLTPRHQALRKIIAHMKLRLDAQSRVEWVEVRAPDGDRMEVTFSQIQVNQPLPSAPFALP